jgi:hypothetical protein
MVRAILDGRKTQTRRILKPQPICNHELWPGEPTRMVIDEDGAHCAVCGAGVELAHRRPSGVRGIPVRFAKGDLIWVKENHRLTECECTEACRGPGHVWYDADASGYRNVAHNKCRPSIFMPRWASRITLQLGDVRLQRLQDITEADAIAEGIVKLPATGRYVVERGQQYFGAAEWRATAAFQGLWGSINGIDGPKSWEANPWIIALDFTAFRLNVDELLKLSRCGLVTPEIMGIRLGELPSNAAWPFGGAA